MNRGSRAPIKQTEAPLRPSSRHLGVVNTNCPHPPEKQKFTFSCLLRLSKKSSKAEAGALPQSEAAASYLERRDVNSGKQMQIQETTAWGFA